MKNNLLLRNAMVYTPEGVLDRGQVLVQNGLIVQIVREEKDLLKDSIGKKLDDYEVVDVKGHHLIPGFVDLHIHGAGGFDAMSGEVEEVRQMSQFLLRTGTTSFLATTITESKERLEKAVTSIREVIEGENTGAEIIGIHLEGPFISEKRTGAQNPEYIREPSTLELEKYIALSNQHIRLITLAPEQPSALDVIQYARNQGITVSIGHSDATYEDVKKAVQLGASHITHLFNGMSPFHHREPGVAGAALMMKELTVELICDGYHVREEVVPFIFQVKPSDQIILITDSVSSTGLPDGDHYFLGGLPCYMKNGQVRLQHNDELAGSCLTMDTALRNAMKFTSKSLEEVLPMLTSNPARQAGVGNRKGSIEVGKEADLVILNEQFEVQSTFVHGKKLYEK